MTLQIAFLFALLAVMVYLFLTEKLPVDLTAFLGLSVLTLAGYVTPEEAFQGFSSPAVINMLAMFIIGAALLETGVADTVGGRIHRIAGDREVGVLFLLMAMTALLSAFMVNVAATAVMMPAVASLARRTGLSPSRLFMPVAFAATLGGTLTLVGTPPNMVAAQVLADAGLRPFELFDFAPLGLALVALGLAYVLLVGRRLLPVRAGRRASLEGRPDLTRVYQLQDRIFSLRIPAGSAVDGQSLAQARIGTTLGVKVVDIRRGGRHLQPQASTVLRAGDVLVVEGEPGRVREFLDMERFEVERLPAERAPALPPGIVGIRLRVDAPPVAGQTLRELDLRSRLGIIVLGIRHRRQLYTDHLAEQTVRVGDELIAMGLDSNVDRLAALPGLSTVERGPQTAAELAERLWVVDVAAGAGLAGRTIAGSRLSEVVGITVAGVLRDGQIELPPSPDTVLEGGDRLFVAADLAAVEALCGGEQIELGPAVGDDALEARGTSMVEVAVAPRSEAEGRTLEELDFGDRYGLIALALWREGRPQHADLARIPLRFGDALLLHGSLEKIQRLADDPDFVLLSETGRIPERGRKAASAVVVLLIMIAIVVSGWQPVHVAAFAAATLAVLMGTLTMKQAYRAIEWRVIFLIAAILPLGFAMERSGAAQFLVEAVAGTAGALGPYGLLVTLAVLASLLSQALDAAPAVVLLAPIAFRLAADFGLSPYPLLMAIALATSAGFMTPFGQKASLLVMGAGSYSSTDYLRAGTPLTILMLLAIVLLVPFLFPF